GVQGAQQALRRVRHVVALVVHVVRGRESLDDGLGAVADNSGDAGVVAEGSADVVVLLPHDRASVAQLGERLRQRTAEPRAHASGKDDGLKSHGFSYKELVFTVDSTTGHLFVPGSCY